MMRSRRVNEGDDEYARRTDRDTRLMLKRQRVEAARTMVAATELDARLCKIEAADSLARSDITTLMDITRALSSQVQGEQASIDTMAGAIGANTSDIAKLVQSSATLAAFVAKLSDDTTAALKALGDRATANANAIAATNQTVAALAAVVAAIPRPVFVGTAQVSFGGIASVGLQPRKVTVAVPGVKKDELLVCRHTAAVPASFGFDSATALADGQVEFVFTTPALTLLVTTTMPMAVYAVRSA